jgi:hypothetical protein
MRAFSERNIVLFNELNTFTSKPTQIEFFIYHIT